MAATVVPQITAADLERARAEGHEAGLRAARAELEAGHARAGQAAICLAAEALGRAESEIAARAQTLADALARSMLALWHTLLEDARGQAAPALLQNLLAVVLPPLRRVPDITISVHPFTLDSLSAAITEAARAYGGAVSVAPDGTLAPGDIRIDWPGGQARHEEAEFKQRVRAALLPLLDSGLAQHPDMDAKDGG